MKGYGVIAFAARRILLRPARWLLFALALSVVTFLASTTVLTLFAVESTATSLIKAGPALVISRVDAGGWAAIDEAHARTIAKIPGVHTATPRVWGVLPGPPSLTVMADRQLTDGSTLARVGSAVRPAAPGELIVLRGLDGTAHELHVEGLLKDETDVVSHDLVLVPVDTARSLLLLPPNTATDIAVQSARDEENEALVGEIADALAFPVRVTTRAEMLGSYRTQTGRAGSIAFLMLLPALLGLVLVVAVTAAGGASTRIEVGKLKLLGWTSGDVARLHSLEVGLVAGAAVALGLCAAYAGLFLLGGASVVTPVFGWTDSQPHLLFSTEGAVLSLLVIGACVFIPCLVAALVPSFRLARSDPAELVEGP